MTIIDLSPRVGNDISSGKLCPHVIATTTPVFSWILPENITQKRWNIRIENQDNNGGYFANSMTTSPEKFFAYPEGDPMTPAFLGLCRCEIFISSSTTGEFEYTSGYFYFVYDDIAEQVYNKSSVTLQWRNSLDLDSQSISYRLMVSNDPTFGSENIIDEIIPENNRSISTSKTITIEHNKTFFWKVCAFDGMDYSNFSRVNGFVNTDNLPPKIEIDKITVTNNEFRDVIIDFTITDVDDNIFILNSFYIGGSAAVEKRMSLINPMIQTGIGNHSITWRSSRDEKLIASEYKVKLVVIDPDGATGNYSSLYFHMDNSAIGLDSGGIGSIDVDFPLSVSMWILPPVSNFSDKPFPTNFEMSAVKRRVLEHVCPTLGSLYSHSSFFIGDAEKGFSTYRNSSNIGNVYYPYGVVFGGNNTDKTGVDLDSIDPDMVSTLSYVNSMGKYPKLTRQEKRIGFIRFINHFYQDKSLCEHCDGRGWSASELIRINDDRYERTECSVCHGSRFSANYTDPIKKSISKYYISQYKKLEDWISPNSDDSNSFFAMKASTPPGRDCFHFGPLKKMPEGSIPQIDAGYYPELVMSSNTVNNVIHNFGYHPFPTIVNEFPIILEYKKDISPVVSHSSIAKQDYIPGFSSAYNEGFSARPQPTHRWESGICKFEVNFGKIKILEPLKIIYLQTGWDAYNTIHWKSTMSSTTRIQIQVCKFFDDGTSTNYIDINSEYSEYEPSINGYLVKPNLWSTFWDSSTQSIMESGKDYRLRIRQFDIISKTSSDWVYSSTFHISDGTPNPSSIIETTYEKWSKQLSITYRIDSSKEDRYELLNMWYSTNGVTFFTISPNSIYGQRQDLSSKRGENIHTIIWDTTESGLVPGNEYRIKMEVIPAKFVDGLTYPILSWSKEDNPERTMADMKILELNGGIQTVIVEEDGTVTSSEIPIITTGTIQERRDTIFMIENNPPPSGVHDFYLDGVIYPSGVLINPSGYQAWMTTQMGDGRTRGKILLDEYAELDNMINTELPYYIKQIIDMEKGVRRNLIDQGFYCNGYVNDEKFEFKVSAGSMTEYPLDNIFVDGYRDREIYNRVQLDFFNTFDSQSDETPLRDFMYNIDGYRIQGVNDSGSSSIRTFSNFTIQKEELPGEIETDIIPSGIESFATTYKWRVNSYNIVKDTPREKPYAIIEEISTSGVFLNVKFRVYGNRDIKKVSIENIMGLNPTGQLEIADSYWEEEDIEFPTDAPPIADGDMNFNSGFSWIPQGTSRPRPSVVLNNYNYYIWYNKKNFFQEHSILHARSKDGIKFGEYDIAIPEDGETVSSLELSAAYNPTVLNIEGIWHMWITAYKAGRGNIIMHSTSGDAWRWTTPVEVAGISDNAYSPCAGHNGKIILYYCSVSNSKSAIFRAESEDGVIFDSDSIYKISDLNLNTPAVVINEEDEIVFCTETDNGVSNIICLTEGYDGISESENPALLIDMIDGKFVLRMYYNKIEDGEHKIKTAIWKDATWSNIEKDSTGDVINSGIISGNTEHLNCDEYGSNLYTTRIRTSYTDGYGNVIKMINDWFIAECTPENTKLIITNDLKQKDYLVQSEWLSIENCLTTNSEMKPSAFKYDPIIKDIDYWRL